jgi:ankyrin repeat protein
MIQVLLNNLDVFDLNRVFKRSDHTITTILQVAVDAGNLDHITRLLENGADPNLQGRQDTTPLIST